MTSVILSTATRFLLPLLLIFSVFLLIRGHNEPGGGFVGGLVAAASFALYAVSDGVGSARRALRVDPRDIGWVGVAVALASGLPRALTGGDFMTGIWHPHALPVLGKLGTPFLFDLGVYLAVVGVVLTIFFALAEE
ncbi:MAG: Na+/H+ antiporter subunit B [Armatimonadetes bacterium]|nr:Na+/H+ antiporter subunit B [Armatimonadota bacterium]